MFREKNIYGQNANRLEVLIDLGIIFNNFGRRALTFLDYLNFISNTAPN